MTKLKKDHRGLCLVGKKSTTNTHVSDYLGDRTPDGDDMQASFDLLKEERKSKEFAAETARLEKMKNGRK